MPGAWEVQDTRMGEASHGQTVQELVLRVKDRGALF